MALTYKATKDQDQMVMGINVWELLLWAVMGWIGIGTAGLVTSWVRLRRGVPEERARIVRGFKWLLAVAVAYVAVVVGVSIVQPRRTVDPGQARCFGTMCYTVTGIEELPRFLGKNQAPDGSRLLRVIVTVKNTGSSRSEDAIRAYLVDAQGRQWEQSKGVSGNRLSGRVATGSTMVSEPVFRIASDATGLGLVLTRGHSLPGVLVIGDSDSLWHRKTVVALGQ